MTIKTLSLTVLLLLLFASGAALLYLRRGDRVFLSNTSGSENGILVDAQGPTAVLSDQRFVSSNTVIRVGRLQAATGSNEVIAFTQSRPVAIASPVSWTSGNDDVNLSFSNQILIPVTIWILEPPFAMQKNLAEQRCIDIVAMWDAERMGVAFSTGGCEVVDATNNPAAPDFLSFRCELQAQMQTKIGKAPGRINIYVVDSVDSGIGNGQSCATNDFIALGSAVDAALVVHELGHSFSLRHSDRWPNFDDTNFMSPNSSVRRYFTEGQLFRAHFTSLPAVLPGSALNDVYSARPGQPTRDCPSLTTSDQCPTIGKRIWADGRLFPPN